MTTQQGRHFAITGASAGIGRAIAIRLAREGAAVSLFARREDALEETARLAREAGAPATSVHPLDVTDTPAVYASFEAAAARLGPLWGVVANAGAAIPNMPGPHDAFETVLQVNLIGAYHTTRAGLAVMAQSEEARHVVVMSSILGRIGGRGLTGYCASKAGLLGMVRALAHEVGRHEIRVNAICPGYVETGMGLMAVEGFGAGIQGSFEDKVRALYRGTPIRRMSKPEEIAGIVSWLVGPDSVGVTGQAIDVNNGMWMG
jgi:NAD(P)-dependent dehydrogenase (short-subunit alcohol dehydrogenase family)